MLKLHLLDGSPVLIQADTFIAHKAIGEEGTQFTTDAGQVRVSETLDEIARAIVYDQTSRI